MSDVQSLMIQAIKNELPGATVTAHADQLGQGWPTVLIDGTNGRLVVSLNPNQIPEGDLLPARMVSVGKAAAQLFLERGRSAGR